MVPSSGRCMRGAYVSRNGHCTLDDRVNEDESLQETWMDESEIRKLAAAHAVADANERSGHLVAEGIDHVEEITAMVKPCRCGNLIYHPIYKGHRVRTYDHSRACLH